MQQSLHQTKQAAMMWGTALPSLYQTPCRIEISTCAASEHGPISKLENVRGLIVASVAALYTQISPLGKYSTRRRLNIQAHAPAGPNGSTAAVVCLMVEKST